MKRFTDSIRKSITNENWFSALFLSLCMPDICGALKTPQEDNGVRYKRWFDTNLSNYTSLFSADDCWYFRCSCLHEGVDGDARMTYDRVHFITPPPRQNKVHRNIFGGVLQMQIDIFCTDMADAVDLWFENTAKQDPDILSRIGGMINIYGPDSLRPYIVL